MPKLKYQLAGALLCVLSAGGGAYAQQAPTNDDSGPVACPPSSADESNLGCPQTPAPQPAPARPAETSQPAQTPPQVAEAEQPVQSSRLPITMREPTGYVPWMAFSVGGGVDGFAGSALRSVASVGGSWNARVTFGIHSLIAGEVSYLGSAQSASLPSTSGTLVGNGAQAAVRINGTRHSMFQPFLYGGLAWRHYSTSMPESSLVALMPSKDVYEVPAGVGIAGYFGDIIADVRGEYRFAWATQNSSDSSLLDRWGVTGNIGFAF